MTERWRQVNGWPYEVSDCGRVRRMETGHILKCYTNKRGYVLATLNRDGQRTTAKVHALVLHAFGDPRPNGYTCDHLNGIKNDNRIENLQWVSFGENTHRAIQDGRINVRWPGSQHASSKLHERDIAAMFALRRAGHTQSEIGIQFGIARGHVSHILRGARWAHVTDSHKIDAALSEAGNGGN